MEVSKEEVRNAPEVLNVKEEIVKCEVCDDKPFRYRCPRCEVQTCSLECVKIHKTELACSGQRDSTAYVPMSKFTNLNLLSDYRFLEDIDRAINNCRRNPLKKYTRHQQPLPTHLYRLKSAAAKRNVHLQFLPQHFSRHKVNKTMLDYKTQEITWKIDLIFPQGEMIKISEIFNEKTRLSSVIAKYLDPINCPEVYKQYLKFYQASGLSDVIVFLKAERVKNPNSVYMLDLFSDINSNLTNKVIIENPVLIVAKKAYKDEYVILDDELAPVQDGVKGSKAGFFGDFSPIGYFDSWDEKPKPVAKGHEAMNSIRESARALRPDRPIKEELEDSDSESNCPQLRKPALHIPTYDNLCNN